MHSHSIPRVYPLTLPLRRFMAGLGEREGRGTERRRGDIFTTENT